MTAGERMAGVTPLDVTVVIPTLGRPSLRDCLAALAEAAGPRPAAVHLVDDRPAGPAGTAAPPLDTGSLPDPGCPVRVFRSGGRGPAAARNVGWRAARTRWVAFLDDDVRVTARWLADLAADLVELVEAAGDGEVAGTQGRIEVPLPADRRPTDWERNTAGLAGAAWITADMAYRRDVLLRVGGFDERFPRAFREDAELALRVLDTGGRLVRGSRRTIHPVRPARWTASLRTQAGNSDDPLMRAVHGPDWRRRAAAPPGRRPRHLAITAAGALAVTSAAVSAVLAAAGADPRPRTASRRLAALAGLGWLAGTAEFAAARIAPGPRTPREIATMVATSVPLPALATGWWLAGLRRHRHATRWPMTPDAVLFDRDGTLVHDVPYNGDPARVEPMPGAAEALRRLRAAGIRLGVVTNQSGMGTGRLTPGQVAAVNARVEALLGPFDAWEVCPHAPDAGCDCRKPAPGLVTAAAAALGTVPERCVVIGDIGADMEAAAAAGARAVLVPNGSTRPEEARRAPRLATDLRAAADLVLRGRA
jgi:HAD superfamily hydrolase (TIGR01662 family)